MSFKAVWGLDPEEVEKAKQRPQTAGDFSCDLDEERPDEDLASVHWAKIPASFEAQIYELRRIFRL